MECGAVLKMWATATEGGPGYYWCNGRQQGHHDQHLCNETWLQWSDEDARLWEALGARTGNEAAAVFAAC